MSAAVSSVSSVNAAAVQLGLLFDAAAAAAEPAAMKRERLRRG